MTNTRDLLQRLEQADVPELWPDVASRTPRSPLPPPSGGPRTRKFLALVVALLATVLSIWFLVTAFTGGSANTNVAATGSRSPASGTSPPPVNAPSCHARQLSTRVIPTDPAAGNVWAPILLQNRSSRACTLSGYPQVRFFDAMGRERHIRVTNSPVFPATSQPSPIPRAPFVLEPGAKSWFIVHFEEQAQPCVHVNRLQIVPPGGTGVVDVHVPGWPVCRGGVDITAAMPNHPPV